ncbi:MYND finger protein, putative, partial [Plasmodium ovale curtisi]
WDQAQAMQDLLRQMKTEKDGDTNVNMNKEIEKANACETCYTLKYISTHSILQHVFFVFSSPFRKKTSKDAESAKRSFTAQLNARKKTSSFTRGYAREKTPDT